MKLFLKHNITIFILVLEQFLEANKKNNCIKLIKN